MSDLVVAHNCCMARMLPREAELVSERTGLQGGGQSVKRFERSNGGDTALYKNYLYILVNRYTRDCKIEWVNNMHQLLSICCEFCK